MSTAAERDREAEIDAWLDHHERTRAAAAAALRESLRERHTDGLPAEPGDRLIG